jgi:hypothetical protein
VQVEVGVAAEREDLDAGAARGLDGDAAAAQAIDRGLGARRIGQGDREGRRQAGREDGGAAGRVDAHLGEALDRQQIEADRAAQGGLGRGGVGVEADAGDVDQLAEHGDQVAGAPRRHGVGHVGRHPAQRRVGADAGLGSGRPAALATACQRGKYGQQHREDMGSTGGGHGAIFPPPAPRAQPREPPVDRPAHTDPTRISP